MDLVQSSALLAAFVNLAVAIAILLRDRRRRLYVRFALLALNLCLWHTASFFHWGFHSEAAAQVRFAAGVFVPASVLSVFSLLVPVRSPALGPLKRTIGFAGVGIAALALTPYFQRQWADALAATYAAASLFVTFQIVWRQSRKVVDRTDRVRLRTLVIGAALAAIFGAADVFQSTLWLPLLGHVSVAIYMYFLYQTIITYRLIDLVELIAKAAVLGTLTIILAALFQLLLYWVGTGRGQFLFNAFIASFVILILYDQIRTWVEDRTIRLLFRERQAMNLLVSAMVTRLRSTLDVRQGVDLALDGLYNDRKLTHVSVYLVRDNEVGFSLLSHRGPKPPNAIDAESYRALFGEIIRQKVPLLRENFERKLVPDPETPPASEAERMRATEILSTYAELGATVVLPMVSGTEVLGLLCLGDAKMPMGFPADEIALAIQVADQLAVAVENSAEFERLRERDRLAALGEMSAGLAHEIRNPLGAIKGAAQVLMTDRFPPESRELLSVIQEEVERLANVVSQFLEYARPLKPALSPTDVNQAISRTLVLFNEERRPDPFEIRTDLAVELPAINSDADQLRQVLWNLLRNAVESFTEGKGSIDISTRVVSSARGNRDIVEIRIRDNGPGIEAENQRRLFVPFFTTKAKGTGLGLAICQRIVTSHGGRIDLVSRMGVGSTFVMRFPALRKDA